MIYSHALTGAFATKLTEDINFAKEESPRSPMKNIIFWTLGITFSVLPDFDLAIFPLTNAKSHHELITHIPLFYIGVTLIYTIILFMLEKFGMKIEKVRFLENIGVLFLLNTLLHLITDVFTGSVMPFTPFYDGTFTTIHIYGDHWLREYTCSIGMAFEFVSMLLGIISIFLIRKKSYFKPALAALSFWVIITALMVTISFAGRF